MRLARVLLTSLLAAAVTPGATITFTDRAAWADAVGSFSSDDFSTAPLGGPLPQYDSPVGVTLRRAAYTENNGNTRSVDTDYNGDVRTDGQPYSSTFSTHQVFVYYNPFGSLPQYLAGPSDHYSSTTGQNIETITRLSDGATRTRQTINSDLVSRQISLIGGTSASPLRAVGFSLSAYGGPFPGTLILDINGEQSVAGGSSTFFGIVTSDPFTEFYFSVQAGAPVVGTENYTNRQCYSGGPPSEVCLASGNQQRSFTDADVSIYELLVAHPELLATQVQASAAVPEPGSGLLLTLGCLGGLAGCRLRHRQ